MANWIFFLFLFFALTGLVTISGAPAGEIQEGSFFPALVLPSMEEGRPLSAADFRGRKTVLHIWASW